MVELVIMLKTYSLRRRCKLEDTLSSRYMPGDKASNISTKRCVYRGTTSHSVNLLAATTDNSVLPSLMVHFRAIMQ